MEKHPSLVISHEDFKKITSLLSTAKTEIAELLEEELHRAELVPADQLSNDVVAMNSEVGFRDLDSGKEQTLTLTYPHDANIDMNRVSVLAPVGAALLGLRVGQTINWPVTEEKTRRIKVISVSRGDLKH